MNVRGHYLQLNAASGIISCTSFSLEADDGARDDVVLFRASLFPCHGWPATAGSCRRCMSWPTLFKDGDQEKRFLDRSGWFGSCVLCLMSIVSRVVIAREPDNGWVMYSGRLPKSFFSSEMD